MPVPRLGKTAKEHDSGVHKNRFANRAARVSWQQNGGPFPREACNGKKNRHRVTGKGGRSVLV